MESRIGREDLYRRRSRRICGAYFHFDGSVLAGKTVVAFEHVYYEDKEVGSHTDIEDEDQSIHFPGYRDHSERQQHKGSYRNAVK